MTGHLLIAACAGLASLLSFFSGFGLGTVLTAVFCFFYPAETAIALSAVVHLSNNVFKFFLLRKHVLLAKVLPFLVGALPAAFAGAYLLNYWAVHNHTLSYQIAGATFTPTLTSFSLGCMLVVFAFLEEVLKKYPAAEGGTALLAGGGMLSGFVGGLTGNQGALRSFFLLRVITNKPAFVATGVCIALFLDAARIPVYAWMFIKHPPETQMLSHMLVATLAAFVGALAGKYLLQKQSASFLHLMFQLCLLAMGLALITGKL